MRILIIFLICTLTLSAQTLTVVDMDTTKLPKVRAYFYATDAGGALVRVIDEADAMIMENGDTCMPLYLYDNEYSVTEYMSALLLFDKSISMTGNYLELARKFGKRFIRESVKYDTEFAVCTFNNRLLYYRDFTAETKQLSTAIDGIIPDGFSRDSFCFRDSSKSVFEALAPSPYKPYVVIITNGMQLPDLNLMQYKANKTGTKFFCVTLGYDCSDEIKEFTRKTGGFYFERVNDESQFAHIISLIKSMAAGIQPCELAWNYSDDCENDRLTTIKCLKNNTEANIHYSIPDSLIAELQCSPQGIKLPLVQPGSTIDTTITLRAINADFVVSDIICNNPDFSFSSTSFSLLSGESHNFSMTFTPGSSEYSFTKIEFQTDKCPVICYVTANTTEENYGSTLKLLQPNGGETYINGLDTIVEWDGVFPADSVMLEYSTDKGNTWKLINVNAKGLSYKWKNIFATESDSCLVRVAHRLDYQKPKLLLSTLSHGNFVLSPDKSQYAVGQMGDIVLIDSKTFEIKKYISDNVGSVRGLSWSPDGSKIVAAARDNSIGIWNWKNGELIRNYKGHYVPTSIDWGPKSWKIAVGYTGLVTINDYDTGEELASLKSYDDIQDIYWNEDEINLILLCKSSAKIWNTETQEVTLIQLNVKPYSFSKFALDPTGKRLASLSNGNLLRIWDIGTGDELGSREQQNANITGFEWNDDGSQIVVADDKGALEILNGDDAGYIKNISSYGSGIYNMTWGPDNKGILFTRGDEIYYKDLIGFDLTKIFDLHGSNMRVSWSPDGQEIASCDSDSRVLIWDTQNGAIKKIYDLGPKIVNTIDWNPNGTSILCSRYRKISILNIASGVVSDILVLNGEASAKWSPDGQSFAYDASKEQLGIYHFGGKGVGYQTDQSVEINQFSWSPDSKMLALSLQGIYVGTSTVIIIDATTGQKIREFPEQSLAAPTAIGWSPDGSKIALSVWREIRIYDAYSMALLYTIPTPYNYYDLKWNHNSRSLAALTEYDHILEIYNIFDNQPIYSYQLYNGSTIGYFDWEPGGDRLARGGTHLCIDSCYLDPNISYADTSDNTLSIVSPRISSYDIEFGEHRGMSCKYEDKYITNSGSIPVKIYNISIMSKQNDINMDIWTPQLPITLAPNESIPVELMCNYSGMDRNDISEVSITYQAGILNQTVSATSVYGSIYSIYEYFSPGYNFGNVKAFRDTSNILTEFIINSGNPPQLDSVKLVGPNLDQYVIENESYLENVSADIDLSVSVKISPKYAGRSSGVMRIYYNKHDFIDMFMQFNVNDYVGIDEPDLGNGDNLLISPNPADSKAKLEFELDDYGPVQIIVTNTLGQVVIAKSVRCEDGKNTIVLDTEILSSGQYFVQLHTANGIVAERLIIRK